MPTLRHDLHSLTGAYALDALDEGPEQDRFVRHLRRCQACTGEVRGMREVATSLAFAAAAEPPPQLRPRVLAAVTRTRQLPPEVTRRRRWWFRWTWPGLHLWLPRLALVTACVAVVVAVVLGVAQVNTSNELSRQRAQAQAIAAVLAAPDVRVLTSAVSTGGTVTVEVSAVRRQMVITVNGAVSLPSGKVYQLWLIGPPATRSAGLVPAAESGRAGPVLASGLAAGDKLGMTVEPAGGTTQPTTTPIVVLSLPS
jgi:anti-sigma-K factor RskA